MKWGMSSRHLEYFLFFFQSNKETKKANPEIEVPCKGFPRPNHNVTRTFTKKRFISQDVVRFGKTNMEGFKAGSLPQRLCCFLDIFLLAPKLGCIGAIVDLNQALLIQPKKSKYQTQSPHNWRQHSWETGIIGPFPIFLLRKTQVSLQVSQVICVNSFGEQLSTCWCRTFRTSAKRSSSFIGCG